MRRAIFVAAAVSLVSAAPALAGGPDHRHGHGYKAPHRVSYTSGQSKGSSRQKDCGPHGVPAPELAAGVPAALAALGALGATGIRRRTPSTLAS